MLIADKDDSLSCFENKKLPLYEKVCDRNIKKNKDNVASLYDYGMAKCLAPSEKELTKCLFDDDR